MFPMIPSGLRFVFVVLEILVRHAPIAVYVFSYLERFEDNSMCARCKEDNASFVKRVYQYHYSFIRVHDINKLHCKVI